MPLYQTDDTSPFIVRWQPQVFRLIEIHSEAEALWAQWKGLRVTKSSVKDCTWHIWVRVEVGQ
jgi:hypothetical protein